MSTVQTSKRLAHALRHNPESEGLVMSPEGWVSTSAVINAFSISPETLKEIVENDSKGRYEFNTNGTQIRARQGHSIPVNIEWEQVIPPKVLFHGTKKAFVPLIIEKGLLPTQRNLVHLSESVETATQVASRRAGESIILVIESERMSEQGHVFQRTANSVWLVKAVPPEFIKVP